jgi:hypothetical protein
MKRTMKTMLFFFAAALVMVSCSEDPNPPVAGFNLSNETPVQWDMATITSTATGATETAYTVTGGTFEMDDATATIQFLEAKTYTIAQTVTNADGTVESSQDVVVTAPDNTYTLEGTEIALGTTDSPNAFWFGGNPYLRFLADVAGQDNPDLIKLYPVAGPNPLQGTYTSGPVPGWGEIGEIGDYYAGMTQSYVGMSGNGWTTVGEGGSDLVIDLVYEDPTNAENNIYDITLASYTLNYGNYDWVGCGCFAAEGTKSLILSYRGKIDPAS